MLLTEETPIQLDVLDAQDNALTRLPATLCRLENELATLELSADSPPSCLHWGARVRFRIGEGAQTCEAIGSIVAHNLARTSGKWLQDFDQDSPREAVVRLALCRPVPQLRAVPRRDACFPVLFQALSNEMTEAPASSALPEWSRARCVNLSAGGMKLRTDSALSAPKELLLRFSLPVSGQETPLFQLRGKTLRADFCGKQNEEIELAVKFMNLTVQDGLALTNFLAK